jgi:hypothetical protein
MGARFAQINGASTGGRGTDSGLGRLKAGGPNGRNAGLEGPAGPVRVVFPCGKPGWRRGPGGMCLPTARMSRVRYVSQHAGLRQGSSAGTGSDESVPGRVQPLRGESRPVGHVDAVPGPAATHSGGEASSSEVTPASRPTRAARSGESVPRMTGAYPAKLIAEGRNGGLAARRRPRKESPAAWSAEVGPARVPGRSLQRCWYCHVSATRRS